MTYSESWRKVLNCHNSPSYYTAWTLNFERILSLCQNQQKTLTCGWDPKVVNIPMDQIIVDEGWWQWVFSMVLKTRLDRSVRPVNYPVRSAQWTILWSNRHWIVQTDDWTVEPDDPFDFLQTGHTLDNKFLFTM